MTPAQRLGKLAHAKNKEIEERAHEELTIGIIFSLVVYGGFFALALFVGFIAMESAWLFAFGLTLVFAALASLVCWRTVNPQRAFLPMDNPKAIAELLDNATPQSMFFHPQYELPGIVSFVFGGPEGVMKWVGMRKNLVTIDEALLERSVKLLKRCDDGYPLRRMKNPQAAVFLRQLALVRAERRDGDKLLVLTQDGRTILSSLTVS